MRRAEADPVFAGEALLIAGAGGRLGRDLGGLAVSSGISLTKEADEASFVALCTPSFVAEEILTNNRYPGKTIIDLSGAAKRNGIGQYGLMRSESEPWSKNLDVLGETYGNPGCIASAVILGLAAAGLTGSSLPKSISVVSVGGRTHAPNIEPDNIKLANRLLDHPHVREIEKAFNENLEVTNFMPVIADVPEGLLVTVHGQIRPSGHPNKGVAQLNAHEVLHTDGLRHKLDISDKDFSLGVAIDNVRFVTANAINLMRYIINGRKT